jgi:hypothetical protein
LVWFWSFYKEKLIPNQVKLKTMKRIFLSFFAIALSIGAFAQETITPPKDTIPAEQNAQSQDVQKAQSSQPTFIMQDGKVYQYKDGEKSELSEDATLSNGTTISPTGAVKKTDGTTATLTNGQYVDQDGNISEWKIKSK